MENKVEACGGCGTARKEGSVYCEACGRPFPDVKVSEASAYWEVLPLMRDVARQQGWCLALYGPLRRNLDMVAIPWSDDAVPYEELLGEIVKMFGGRYSSGIIGTSVNRTGVMVNCRKRLMRDNGSFVDISVIDPRVKPEKGCSL